MEVKKMKKICLALSVIFLIGIASAQTYQYGMMGGDGQFYPTGSSGFGGGMMGMMGGYGNYGSGIMALSWFTYLLFIALVITAIYWLIKSANRKK
jgi:hypothetical protein